MKESSFVSLNNEILLDHGQDKQKAQWNKDTKSSISMAKYHVVLQVK